HVAMADGSTRALPKTLDAATLRAAITPAGGEVIDWAKIDKPVISPARQRLLDKLREKNDQLKEEANILGEILGEMRAELHTRRSPFCRRPRRRFFPPREPA